MSDAHSGSSCHISANSCHESCPICPQMLPSNIFGADAALSYDPPAGAQDFNWRASGVGGFWNSLRVCVGGRAVFVVSHQLQGGGAG